MLFRELQIGDQNKRDEIVFVPIPHDRPSLQFTSDDLTRIVENTNPKSVKIFDERDGVRKEVGIATDFQVEDDQLIATISHQVGFIEDENAV